MKSPNPPLFVILLWIVVVGNVAFALHDGFKRKLPEIHHANENEKAAMLSAYQRMGWINDSGDWAFETLTSPNLRHMARLANFPQATPTFPQKLGLSQPEPPENGLTLYISAADKPQVLHRDNQGFISWHYYYYNDACLKNGAMLYWIGTWRIPKTGEYRIKRVYPYVPSQFRLYVNGHLLDDYPASAGESDGAILSPIDIFLQQGDYRVEAEAIVPVNRNPYTLVKVEPLGDETTVPTTIMPPRQYAEQLIYRSAPPRRDPCEPAPKVPTQQPHPNIQGLF